MTAAEALEVARANLDAALVAVEVSVAAENAAIANRRSAMNAAREARDAFQRAEEEVWLERDRETYPTPANGLEEVTRHHRDGLTRRVHVAAGFTGAGSLIVETRASTPRGVETTRRTHRRGTFEYRRLSAAMNVKP